MSTNVVMPQLGESVVEGTVGKWLKQVGDPIQQYEPILEVITDKVNTEIPAPAAGTLLQILVPEGTTVQAGSVIALIGDPSEIPSLPPAPPTPAPEQPSPSGDGQSAGTATPEPSAPASDSARNRFTPVVARMISEYRLTPDDLRSIRGTGENGRISKKDLEKFLKLREAAPPTPVGEVDQTPASTVPAWEQPGTGELFRPTEEVFGKPTSPAAPPPRATTAATPSQPSPDSPGDVIPLSPMRRAIAEHMVRSKTIAPHVTTVHEADLTQMLAHFEAHKDEFARQGVKLTYTPYLVQAAVHALQQVPVVNARFTEQGILMQRALNIGIAVALPEGLIVPVVKNADEKSLLGLARAVNDLAARARDGKLAPDEATGGTFTLTNYGVFGSLFGTPVISQPQSAILGVGAIQKRVVVLSTPAGDSMAIRPMVYLALSFDHRLIDGAIGDTFMRHVKEFLENYPPDR